MSRSFRVPSGYRTTSVDPVAGKKATSQTLRGFIKAQLHAIKRDVDEETLDDVDPFVDDPRDVNRGNAGTRSPDHGWDYFGDGRVTIRGDDWTPEFKTKKSRK